MVVLPMRWHDASRINLTDIFLDRYTAVCQTCLTTTLALRDNCGRHAQEPCSNARLLAFDHPIQTATADPFLNRLLLCCLHLHTNAGIYLTVKRAASSKYLKPYLFEGNGR